MAVSQSGMFEKGDRRGCPVVVGIFSLEDLLVRRTGDLLDWKN